MIECPSCGATNRPESRFCAECGQSFGAVTGLTCPMCDTANAPGVMVCAQCGARLMPLGISPSDLPLEEVGPGEEGVAAERREGALADQDDVGDLQETGEEVGVSAEAGEEAVPPWLRKLETLPDEGMPGQPDEGKDLELTELPDWLDVPPEFQALLDEVSPTTEAEGVEPAEIPSWLHALGEGEEEVVEEETDTTGPGELTGLLKGITGVLGIEPILAIPRRAGPAPVLSPITLAHEGAGVFEAVVREPARPGITVARPRLAESLAASTVRWMTYLIVATAVVVPILLGSNWSEANMPTSAGTTATYGAIEGLAQDTVVLISHDYDPGVAGEMIPQVKIVLDHLMRRRARLINVSLTPEGARLSRQVLDELADVHGYVSGEDYLSLGYVVGVEAGPRLVVEGLVASGWSDFVDDVGDIGLIVEFAGGPEYLRLWLEQVQGPYGVPMVAGVSATADPFARPYYNNEGRRQLSGLMTGLVGAAEYERQSGQAGMAMASMDSQSLVHVAIVFLILVGNLAYFGGRLRGRLSQ